MRTWMLAAVGLAAGLLPAGCGDELPSAGAPAATRPERTNRPLIAFVGAAPGDPLWPVLRASAERHLERWDTFEVQFLVPDRDVPQSQADLLASLTDPRLHGLCIQIHDVAAVEKRLERLHQRGVAIVSMLQPAPAAYRAAHVGLDESAIGRALVDATAAALDEQGTVMLLHAGPEHPVHGPRLLGLEERLANYRQIEVLARIDCQANPRTAREIVVERSGRYPRLSAWVSLGDWLLNDVTSESPLPAPCRLITFGGLPHQWSALRAGVVPVLVAADYGELGIKALQFCENAIRNSSPHRFRDSYTAPLRILRSADLDAYEREWRTWAGQ